MKANKKFAVVLSGCGVYDGAEIHEAVLTLYAIEQNGCSYQIFAPDTSQQHVINHLTGQEMGERRNVLIESARIARGKALPLSKYNPNEFDALIFPGGFGVAKNLCSFALEGPNCTLNPEVEKAIAATHALKKPIGALCIAPVLLARALGRGLLTIGQDMGTAKAMEAMGATHKPTGHGEVAIDKENLFFTTPCYMLDAKITDIAKGTQAVVEAMLMYI